MIRKGRFLAQVAIAVGLFGLPLFASSRQAQREKPVPTRAQPKQPQPAPREPRLRDIRGITVSCWHWGYEWADPDMRTFMATLPEVGANWLTIHPYAQVSRRTGEVEWSTDDRTDHVVNPIRWAKELGLKIMIKPHLAYWGQFDWAGDIGWGDDIDRWQRFRASYAAWVVHLARISGVEGADLFVVGTELRQVEPMVDYWRGLIRDVRLVYSGPVTYASNWDDFERLKFWPELDYIGVQAYFPLSSQTDPDAATLRAGWQGPIAAMTRLSNQVGRPVILTELGYPSADWAASRPWQTSRGTSQYELQARCLKVALDVAAGTPVIAGAFIWKWFPTLRDIGPGDFTVQTADFKRLLREAWRHDPGAERRPPVRHP